jgi:5,10-methylenetetrahydrofolate reductase
MEEAARAGVVRERGLELASRVIQEVRPYCQGIHVMAIGLEAEVPEILRAAGLVHASKTKG